MYCTDILQRSLVAIYLQKPLPQSPKQSQEKNPKHVFLVCFKEALWPSYTIYTKAIAPKPQRKPEEKPKACFLACLLAIIP